MANPTIFDVATLDQLDGAIAYVDAQSSGSYTIQLTANITAGTSALVAGGGGALAYPDGVGGGGAMSSGQPVAATNQFYALNTGADVTIDGGGFTLSGDNTYRGLFVYNGDVTIQNLTIADAMAKGGSGGLSGGGGGAGLGGGLFVAGPNAVAVGSSTMTTGGDVTLDNVVFTGDSAVGGAGGHGRFFGGGGGGLGGNGGPGQGFGPGGAWSKIVRYTVIARDVSAATTRHG